MKRFTLAPAMAALAFLLLPCGPLTAQVGQTPEQCDARYGQAKIFKSGSHRYQMGTEYIKAEFGNGICGEIRYSLKYLDKTFTSRDRFAKIQEILKENSGGFGWDLTDLDGGAEWTRTDSKVVALFGGGELVVSDKAYVKARDEAKATALKREAKEGAERGQAFHFWLDIVAISGVLFWLVFFPSGHAFLRGIRFRRRVQPKP